MTTTLQPGPFTWSMVRESDGHRTYKLTHRVSGSCSPGSADGPANVLQTAGLPLPGSLWQVDGDADIWAWCHPDAVVTPEVEGKQNEWWKVEQTFSTKPFDAKRCHDTQIEDPLLEPQKVSGTFVKYTEEATHAKNVTYYSIDTALATATLIRSRLDDRILNSAHEIIRGAAVEFDCSRVVVHIEQNVPLLQLALLGALNDHVNQYPLWGFPARFIKLSVGPWEKKYYGSCYAYYTRTMDFDIWVKTHPVTGETISGHDRYLLDEGSKATIGRWTDDGRWETPNFGTLLGFQLAPDPLNPAHFQQLKDRQGENTRAPLDGLGKPAGVGINMVRQGVVTAGSAACTGLSATSDLAIGMTVSGTQIAGGTTIAAIVSGTAVTLSAAATGSGSSTVTITFKGTSKLGEVQVLKCEEGDFLLLGIPTVF